MNYLLRANRLKKLVEFCNYEFNYDSRQYTRTELKRQKTIRIWKERKQDICIRSHAELKR